MLFFLLLLFVGICVGGIIFIVVSSYFFLDILVWCKFGIIGFIYALFNGDGSVRCKFFVKVEGDILIVILCGNLIDFVFDYIKIFKM